MITILREKDLNFVSIMKIDQFTSSKTIIFSENCIYRNFRIMLIKVKILTGVKSTNQYKSIQSVVFIKINTYIYGK